MTGRDNIESKKYGRFPERDKARRLAASAIRSGRLVRQPCKRCGTKKNVQAHHDDYSKPLDVEWLCFDCHRDEHAGRFKGGASSGNSKLSASDIPIVRARLASGESQTAIARDLRVTKQSISSVRMGRTWRHVTNSETSGAQS
jgi:hypothetical protein